MTDARDRLNAYIEQHVDHDPEFPAILDAFRAEVLREAADMAEKLRGFDQAFGARKAAQVSENVGILRVVDELRGMADAA